MPLFTRENAREYARKGNLARWSQPRFQSQQPANANTIAEVDSYLLDRLARVREQLDNLDSAVLKETLKANPDGQRLNWLAQAQDRLSDQERILAGRPLPGSMKPTPSKGRSSNPMHYTEAPTPVPAVPVAPVAPAATTPAPSPIPNPIPASVSQPDQPASDQPKESLSPGPTVGATPTPDPGL